MITHFVQQLQLFVFPLNFALPNLSYLGSNHSKTIITILRGGTNKAHRWTCSKVSKSRKDIPPWHRIKWSSIFIIIWWCMSFWEQWIFGLSNRHWLNRGINLCTDGNDIHRKFIKILLLFQPWDVINKSPHISTLVRQRAGGAWQINVQSTYLTHRR